MAHSERLAHKGKGAGDSYYLHADSSLSTVRPILTSGNVRFKADPYFPCEIPGRAFPGAKDTTSFDRQAEVRTFTSDTLTEPIEWTGKVKAEMYLASSAQDTDLIVRVSDVYPDGRSILLVDYIRRVRGIAMAMNKKCSCSVVKLTKSPSMWVGSARF